MNIAFIFHSPIIPFLGGVQRVSDILAREFIEMGHNVIFISTSEYCDDYTCYTAKQYYLAGYMTSKQDYINQYSKILVDNCIDVCLIQELIEETLFLLKNTPKSIKTVAAYHTVPYPFVGKERRIKKNLHSKSLKVNFFKYLIMALPWIGRYKYINTETKLFSDFINNADKLVLLSERFFENILKYQPHCDVNKLAAINNPNTFSLPDNTETEKQKIIIVVARLVEVPKNIREFIDVWSILCVNNPGWKALIIGDGSDRQYLEEYANKKCVTNIEFLGHISDVSQYYKNASFVCTTSLLEGWGMSLTEGMAYGCIPCAYGSYGSVYDIIDDGINGIISTPFKPHVMANRIQSVIDDDKLYKQISQNAKNKVKLFSAKNTAIKWINMFNSLINDK